MSQVRAVLPILRAGARVLWPAVPPVLAALYPLIAIVREHSLSHHFSATMIGRPAAALILLALVVYLVFLKALGHSRRSSIAATAFVIVLGAFPYLFADADHGWTVAVGYVAASVGLALAASWLLEGRLAKIVQWTVALLVGANLAVAVARTTVRPSAPWREAVDSVLQIAREVDLRAGRQKPDIYYIVLDGMARLDVLERLYDLDTAEARRDLEALGFQLPTVSRSNYSQTMLSLASSLNMQYLDGLAQVMPEGTDRRPLSRLVEGAGTIALLQEHGYEVVTVTPATTVGIQGSQADRCLCRLPPGPTELEHALLIKLPIPRRDVDRFTMRAHRRHVLGAFDLIESARSDRPMFLMAHVMSPHPPFVVGPEGSERLGQRGYSLVDGDGFPGTRAEYIEGYRSQASFVLRRLGRTLKHIVSTSPDSVVVVHGDHGSGLGLVNADASRTDAWERLAIFSAYYSADRDAVVPDDISPVNSLRWALRAGLRVPQPLLPNRSYLSDYERPYLWKEIR